LLFFPNLAFAVTETDKQVLTDNYEKSSCNIGNRHMQLVNTGQKSFYHPGVDFKGSTGSLVISPLDGVVIGVQDKKIISNYN